MLSFFSDYFLDKQIFVKTRVFLDIYAAFRKMKYHKLTLKLCCCLFIARLKQVFVLQILEMML